MDLDANDAVDNPAKQQEEDDRDGSQVQGGRHSTKHTHTRKASVLRCTTQALGWEIQWGTENSCGRVEE